MATDKGGELRRGAHVANQNTQTVQGWWQISCYHYNDRYNIIFARYYLAYRLLKDNITEKNGVNEFKVRDVIQNTYT